MLLRILLTQHHEWNKNENTRFAIRGDWDGDGFDEMLQKILTKLFSDNDDITPLNLLEI